MEYPSCFPDLASELLLAVSKNKVCFKWTKTSGYRRRPKNTTMTLKAIPEHEFQICFQQWQYRWVNCTAAQAEYFEGDPTQ